MAGELWTINWHRAMGKLLLQLCFLALVVGMNGCTQKQKAATAPMWAAGEKEKALQAVTALLSDSKCRVIAYYDHDVEFDARLKGELVEQIRGAWNDVEKQMPAEAGHASGDAMPQSAWPKPTMVLDAFNLPADQDGRERFSDLQMLFFLDPGVDPPRFFNANFAPGVTFFFKTNRLEKWLVRVLKVKPRPEWGL